MAAAKSVAAFSPRRESRPPGSRVTRFCLGGKPAAPGAAAGGLGTCRKLSNRLFLKTNSRQSTGRLDNRGSSLWIPAGRSGPKRGP